MLGLTTRQVIDQLRLDREMDELRAAIRAWVGNSDPNVREMLSWQFDCDAKYFRPLTVLTCHRAVSEQPVPANLMTSAQVVEMFHNVSLIIDDIVDKSPTRRGKLTLHAKYGDLIAYMVAGYIVSDGYDILARQVLDDCCDMCGCDSESEYRRRENAVDDRAHTQTGAPDAPLKSRLDRTGLVSREARRELNRVGPVRYDVRLLSELLKRLGVAECVQWTNRKQLLGLADWRYLAREDTGSMFEVCAALGARSQRLRRFGRLLGMLYHGCDDVADVKQAHKLGGGGKEDLEEGILTLPAALAIRDPCIAELFCKQKRTEAENARLLQAFKAELGNAEKELQNLADSAVREARDAEVRAPAHLIALVEQVRDLST